MLPPPPNRLTNALPALLRRLDSHTLWAFNSQPPLRPVRTEEPPASS